MSFDTRCVKTGTRVMICTGVDSRALVRKDKLRYVKRTSRPQNEQDFRATCGELPGNQDYIRQSSMGEHRKQIRSRTDYLGLLIELVSVTFITCNSMKDTY